MARSTHFHRLTALTIAACFLCLGVVQAKRPPSDDDKNPPGGIVYFIHEGAVWSMGADGSNPMPVKPRGDTWSDPSHLRHGPSDERWFVKRVVPPDEMLFPNGRSFVEVWAESELGPEMPLVLDRNIEVISPATWTPRDSAVSFIGERWSFDDPEVPVVVETGLYVVDIVFDESGPVPGSVVFCADLKDELRADAMGFSGEGGSEVAGHSWSPDQPSFTFGVRTSVEGSRLQEIWIVDLSLVDDPNSVPSDALTLLDSGKGIGWPEWSPDGRRIGYVSWNGTYIYDRTKNRNKLLQRTPNDAWGLTEWSPDGSHFVLYHWDNFSGYDAIYRFTASVTRRTELTAGLCPPDASFDCVLIPLGWRD